MTLEFILRCAIGSMIRGHHTPHCFSARVQGRGYIGKGETIIEGLTIIHDRAEYLHQLERTATSDLENLDYASGYAEPGYTDPAKGIIFGDWNHFPSDIDRILERAGYATQWSDEWTTCSDCGKAVRISADSYSYQPSYVLLHECEIVCLDCVDWPDYLTSIEDDANTACMRACYPGDYGYSRLSDEHEYEIGWHPGQDDNPATILKALHATGKTGVIFRVSETSQFYCRFETWVKDEETE